MKCAQKFVLKSTDDDDDDGSVVATLGELVFIYKTHT